MRPRYDPLRRTLASETQEVQSTLYIPPDDQPAWQALLDAWLADYQPDHHAVTELVHRLAAADFTAKRHARQLADGQQHTSHRLR